MSGRFGSIFSCTNIIHPLYTPRQNNTRIGITSYVINITLDISGGLSHDRNSFLIQYISYIRSSVIRLVVLFVRWLNSLFITTIFKHIFIIHSNTKMLECMILNENWTILLCVSIFFSMKILRNPSKSMKIHQNPCGMRRH